MKVLAWLTRLAFAALLVSGCSMYATWVTVQMVLDKVLVQYGIRGPEQKAKFSEFLAQMAGNANIINQLAGNNARQSKLASGADGGDRWSEIAGADKLGSSGSGGDSAAKEWNRAASVGEAAKDAGGDALPVWSQSGQQQAAQGQTSGEKKADDAAEQKKKVVVTTEQFQKTKDKLSNDDKMKIFSLLVTKLPQGELQNISRLVEDGITAEELAQVEGIVEEHLTSSEYKQLLTILEKY